MSSARTRSRESRARPSRERIAAARPSGSSPSRREAGGEAEEPENAQIVLANPRFRLADETHPPCDEILESADIIVDRSVSAERKRVDGEIASLGVGGEVASERHLGPTPICLDVLAQRRRFERTPVDDDRHRAMSDAGQGDLEPRLARAADHFVGRGRGREVEIDRWARRAPDRAPRRRRGGSPRPLR